MKKLFEHVTKFIIDVSQDLTKAKFRREKQSVHEVKR